MEIPLVSCRVTGKVGDFLEFFAENTHFRKKLLKSREFYGFGVKKQGQKTPKNE